MWAPMTSRKTILGVGLAFVALWVSSCDRPTTAIGDPDPAMASDHQIGSTSNHGLTPFVTIGVSIEEGRQSGGTSHTSQEEAWPAQFARLANIQFSQPLIADPGCPVQFLAPLSSGALTGPAGTCGANLPGVTLPANDVAVTNATTNDALFTTPEIAAEQGAFRGLRYSRILPPGHTQVTAMLAQHPRLVMVDLGGADVVGTLFGSVADVVPYDEWRQDYDQVIQNVRSTGARGVLVWFTSDLSLLAGTRRGWELYADRAEFAAHHIDVPQSCNTIERDNLVYVADFVFQLTSAELEGEPLPTLSCSNVPDTEDDVITPRELAQWKLDAIRREIHVRLLARAAGYGFFKIDDALFRTPGFKPRFSLSAVLESDHPYGPLMSLDDLHPNKAGHALIARAAARALAAAYGQSF